MENKQIKRNENNDLKYINGIHGIVDTTYNPEIEDSAIKENSNNEEKIEYFAE